MPDPSDYKSVPGHPAGTDTLNPGALSVKNAHTDTRYCVFYHYLTLRATINSLPLSL